MRQREQHRGLIGLDIGSTSVKLVELSGPPGSFELENIAVVSVPDDASADAYARATSMLLEGKELSTNRAATSVCGRKVAVRGMRFPVLADAELDGAIRYEGSQVIAFELSDSYVDHCIVNSGVPGDKEANLMDVLFVAARREAVDAKTSVIEHAGLEPRVVGVDALVLLEALKARDDIPETVGVINIGAASTSIGIAGNGTVPFVRDIDIAGNSYTRAVADVLGVSLEEAEKIKIMNPEKDITAVRAMESVTRLLVGELSRSLVYYHTRGKEVRVETLYLCGGGSALPHLDREIESAVDIRVERWSPLDAIEVDQTRFDKDAVKRLAAVTSLAAALAMKQDPN